MKQLLTLLSLITFAQKSFGQDSTYKYVYTVSLNHIMGYVKSKSGDSLPIPSIKSRLRITSRRELSNKEIESIKQCVESSKTRPSAGVVDFSPCSAKNEYYVEALI